jgi:hypothetical protein
MPRRDFLGRITLVKRSSKVVVGGLVLGAVGWGLWEMAKWGLAVAAAPETAGASLVAALVLP